MEDGVDPLTGEDPQVPFVCGRDGIVAENAREWKLWYLKPEF